MRESNPRPRVILALQFVGVAMRPESNPRPRVILNGKRVTHRVMQESNPRPRVILNVTATIAMATAGIKPASAGNTSIIDAE